MSTYVKNVNFAVNIRHFKRTTAFEINRMLLLSMIVNDYVSNDIQQLNRNKKSVTKHKIINDDYQ